MLPSLERRSGEIGDRRFRRTRREVAYDREFRLSRLAEALDLADEYGITVVSMKRDWKTVSPPP